MAGLLPDERVQEHRAKQRREGKQKHEVRVFRGGMDRTHGSRPKALAFAARRAFPSWLGQDKIIVDTGEGLTQFSSPSSRWKNSARRLAACGAEWS